MVLNALLLAAASFIAWLISTVSAGGGGLLLIPVISFLIGSQAVAPVITMTTRFGGPSRVYLFWKHIRWEIVAWYLPGAIAGAFVGAYNFTRTEAGWLQVILGLFLVSTIFQISLSSGLSLELLSVGALFVAFCFVYRLGWQFFRLRRIRTIVEELSQVTVQIKVRGVIALLMAFVVLASVLGVELILGAFLAGMIISLIKAPGDTDLTHKLEAFEYGFFI